MISFIKLFFTILFLTLLSLKDVLGQRRVLVSMATDLYKTDNYGLFDKYQIGAEFNYFLIKEVALGGGFEKWSSPKSSYFVIGTRIYPIRPLFIRFRGLIYNNKSDFSAGGGYSMPIYKIVRAEFMADYYLNTEELGLRIGLALVF